MIMRPCHRPTSALLRIATGLFITSLAATLARAAIPAGKDVPTERQYLEREAAFGVKLALDNYDAHGVKSAEWDEPARQFIEEGIRRFVTRPTSKVPGDLRESGKKLIKKKCTDPMVEFWVGWMEREEHGSVDTVARMRESALKLRKQGYDPVLAALAMSQVSRWYRNNNYVAEHKKYDGVILEYIPDFFKDHRYATAQRDILCRHLVNVTDLFSSEMHQKAWDAVKDLPDADPVALRLMEGRAHFSRGWHERGGGMMPTIAADELAKAAPLLSKAWEMDKTNPEASRLMIRVAIATQGIDAARTWFDRTVAARFDYRDAYEEFLECVSPRWNGDRDSLLKFGFECADTRRYDTKVPMFFLDALGFIKYYCDNDDPAVWSDPRVYARVRDILDGSTGPGGVRENDPFYISMKAAYYAGNEHWDDARRAIDSLKGPLDPEAIKDHLVMAPRHLRGEIYCFSGPAGPILQNARTLASQGNRDIALAGYQSALKVQTDPTAFEYLNGVIQGLRWEIDATAGKEINLLADAKLSGFETMDGYWKAEPDGTITATAPATQFMRLICLADFGDSWELHVDVEYANHRADWDGAGVVLQTPAFLYPGFMMRQNPSRLLIQAGRYASERDEVAEVKADVNTMIVRRAGSTVTVLVNGKEVHTQEIPPDDPKRPTHIGLGGNPVFTGDRIHFKNMTIRRIVAGQ